MSTATDEPLDADLCSYDFAPGSLTLVCTVHTPGLCPWPAAAAVDWQALVGFDTQRDGECEMSEEPCCDGCASGLGPCRGPGYQWVCIVHHAGLCLLPDTAAERDWDATFGDREVDP